MAAAWCQPATVAPCTATTGASSSISCTRCGSGLPPELTRTGKHYDMDGGGDGTVLYCRRAPWPIVHARRGSGAVRIGRKEGYADYVVGRYYAYVRRLACLPMWGTTTGMVRCLYTGRTVAATDTATCDDSHDALQRHALRRQPQVMLAAAIPSRLLRIHQTC